MRPAGRATPWDRAKPGRELQPPTSPGTPRPPQGGWWVSGGEAGGSGARVRLGLPSWGAPSWQWACGFSQGLVAGVMGWLQARHPSLAEAAPGLRLLLPAVWDESCRGGESPASPHPPPPPALVTLVAWQHRLRFLTHPSAQQRRYGCSVFCKGRAAWGASKGLGRDRQHRGLERVPKSDSSAPRVPSQARCWMTFVQAPNPLGRLGPRARGKQSAAGIWLGSISSVQPEEFQLSQFWKAPACGAAGRLCRQPHPTAPASLQLPQYSMAGRSLGLR